MSKIDWEKCDENIQVHSIQAIVVAVIAEDSVDIESVSCSVQEIESFLPIQSESMTVSMAITNSSNQSHTTCLEHESSELENTSDVDDSDCPATRLLGNKLNPKCMTMQEAQSKDKIISEIVHLYKSKQLCCCNINENDTNEMKQFIRQCSWLFMQKGSFIIKQK